MGWTRSPIYLAMAAACAICGSEVEDSETAALREKPMRCSAWLDG
jgi:hypothetical protein